MLIKCARVLHKQHDKGMSGKVTTTPSFSLQDTKALCNSCERATNLPRAQFWLHKQQKFYQTFSKQEQAWQTPAGVALACKYSTGSPDTGGKPIRSVAGHNILKGLHQPLGTPNSIDLFSHAQSDHILQSDK
jgi:hypothetical protein